MKLLQAFLSLVRWPNLVFIALTQFLFFYTIVIPSKEAFFIEVYLSLPLLVLLVLASVCIAAAGYIINDYFDLNIDLINKPEKLVVEKMIKRRWVIFWHFFLSMMGVALSFFVAIESGIWLLGMANILCVVLLFLYSISFKKKLLSGNILISILTAWVILVICMAEVRVQSSLNSDSIAANQRILRLGILYAGFAFVISLIREAVKDMEDIVGDRKYGCTTMPIVWGIQSTKIFISTWVVILIAILIALQVYVMPLGWWWSMLYATGLLIYPLFKSLFMLQKANKSEDYHKVSSIIKLVMLFGILSMVFFKWYGI
ncbi:MAG: geranylgeranylglycerol-phosphate geranylgeranyltransferase [Hydrotalea sp.]|nr:geranylgeranylglycerol-phosphate geranylgeranyltransferase [Hydrotalea sp.]